MAKATRDRSDWVRIGLLTAAFVASIFAAFYFDKEWAKTLIAGATGAVLTVFAQEASHWWRRPKLS